MRRLELWHEYFRFISSRECVGNPIDNRFLRMITKSLVLLSPLDLDIDERVCIDSANRDGGIFSNGANKSLLIVIDK